MRRLFLLAMSLVCNQMGVCCVCVGGVCACGRGAACVSAFEARKKICAREKKIEKTSSTAIDFFFFFFLPRSRDRLLSRPAARRGAFVAGAFAVYARRRAATMARTIVVVVAVDVDGPCLQVRCGAICSCAVTRNTERRSRILRAHGRAHVPGVMCVCVRKGDCEHCVQRGRIMQQQDRCAH
jgi:hypothetical protein